MARYHRLPFSSSHDVFVAVSFPILHLSIRVVNQSMCPSLNGMRNVKGTPVHSIQGHPVFSTDENKYSSSSKVVNFLPERQSVPSRPKRLNSLTKRSSSSLTTLVSSCSCPTLYAGPEPTGPDGNCLKSCLKKAMSSTDVRRKFTSSGSGVSFGKVFVREYCRQVGDNPSVSAGCPLAIGWMFNSHGEIDIDSYEADRAIDRAPARCERLSSKRREEILVEVGGIPHTQIVQGQMQAYLDRSLRTETLVQIGGPCNAKHTSNRERFMIIKESVSRKFDRVSKGISPTREQRKLWEAAHEAARQQSNRRTL